MAMDMIIIEEITTECILGCYPEERITPQRVVISITLFADLRAAGISDELAHTINYHQLQLDVIALAESSACKLIEKLVDIVAARCFEEPLVERCRVRIDKPSALQKTKTVGVQIERSRS